jgi:hypothetical protein
MTNFESAARPAFHVHDASTALARFLRRRAIAITAFATRRPLAVVAALRNKESGAQQADALATSPWDWGT